jgi:HAMP domain-containing protein
MRNGDVTRSTQAPATGAGPGHRALERRGGTRQEATAGGPKRVSARRVQHASARPPAGSGRPHRRHVQRGDRAQRAHGGGARAPAPCGGTKGQIAQRASIGDVTGAWSASIDCVNALIADLALPTSETARVIGAVAKGDLSQTMPLENAGRPLEGEFLRTSKIVNTMVEQLGAFASEVTRVAREVGTEGKLGGQAEVKGAAGTWKDLTDSVNLMAGNLTAQVRNIAEVTTAVANGDLSKKITVDVKGEILGLKNTINVMVDQLNSFASEVTRVAREVGTEGKLGGQAVVRGISGTWKDLTDNVNLMASNLTGQVRNIAAVTTAVANGDLSKKITVDVKGEILELKNTINSMVDQLGSFASEVTRVVRLVGTKASSAARPR